MILDHIEPLRLNDAETGQHHDALMALARLAEGLSWLNREVSTLERRAQADALRDDTIIAVVGGVLDKMPLGLLACAFQWYAVSACNYVQLAGWLASQDASYAKQYVRKVLPRILNYRNKVAAHFAVTDPKRDNEADLAASVMTYIVYTHGRLCAAALTPVLTADGQEVTVTKDISWSLTKAHERLVPRFWPEGPPKPTQAFPVPPHTTVTLNISWSDVLDEGPSS